MIEEMLDALLWQARIGLRSGRLRVHAGHGYADSSYRPPSLPFVSVLGPLDVSLEPERSVHRIGRAEVRTPGVAIGATRAGAVPANGGLRLRFDGHGTVDVVNLPGGPFVQNGAAIATAIDNQLQAALQNATFVDVDGTPLPVDATAALDGIRCLWDPDGRRLAIHSAPSGVSFFERSSVEIIDLGTNPAVYGLAGDGFESRPGVIRHHQLPPPLAMAVDVRIDLWTATQRHLASLMDEVSRLTPTRGQLPLLPALLAEDVAEGALVIRLATEGEPTTQASLVHYEPIDGDRDRVADRVAVLANNAVIAGAPPRLQLAGNATAAWRVHPTPLVPDPRYLLHPMRGGYALTLAIALAQPLGVNEAVRVATLRHQNADVFALWLRHVAVNAEVFVEIVATAVLGAPPATARTVWRRPEAFFAGLVELHIAVDARSGAVELFANGEAQRLDDAVATPVAPIRVPGTPAGGRDMTLELGAAGGNPVDVDVFRLHLLAEPLGPLDPRLRASPTAAAQFVPGDPVVIAHSSDGLRGGEWREQAIVRSTSGDTITLTAPLAGGFRRGQALVFREEAFFHQKTLRRRDDLLNHLFRCSVEYRVSGLLVDRGAVSSAPLVTEEPDPIVVARPPGRPTRPAERRSIPGTPGTIARDQT